MRHRRIIVAALCCWLWASAEAETHEFTIYMDTALGGPQSGHTWAIEQFPIAPFSPAVGDTLILHIQFDRPLLVEEVETSTTNERVMIILDTGATSTGGAYAQSYGTFVFPDAEGSLLTSTVGWATRSGGFGIGASRSTDLTDSSFVFSRLDVTWHLSTFSFNPPSDAFRYIWVTFDADRISVVPITVEELLSLLLDGVTGVGPGTSLADKVSIALAYYEAQDTQSTCEILSALDQQVEALQGKKIEETLASDLISDVSDIRDMVGCD